MSSIRYDKDAAGIVTLTLDAPNAPVNTMNAAFQADLRDTVERLYAEREAIRGVILTSAKRSFFAGGDLKALAAVKPDDAASFFAEIEALKTSLRRLETIGLPVVAAINGSALGGGLELALACHARFCLEDPRIEIGFPEVTLGLLPGAGGVVKSVRLLGLQVALPLLTEGRRLSPAQALQAGWLHGVAADPAALLAQARAWIDAHPQAQQPWDDPKHRIPGGTPATPAVAGMLAVAPAMLHEKTRGNFPAPEAILAVAVEGAHVDVDTALRIESRYLTRLATGQVAKNMIGTLFFQLNEVKAGKSRPAGLAAWRAKKVGILGAGMMGAGIAWACASRGIACVLKDVNGDKAEAGKAHSERLLAQRVAKGRSSADDAQRTLALIQPTADVGDLGDCDLIIEAVFEDRALKAAVTHEVESVLGDDVVVASNTSTLPITGLAKASRRPDRFIGLHFFSPVDRMQLVEIIRGAQTSDETLARAYDFVLQIGKTPIVVNDARGFYTSRVFGTFVNEGMALLGEGVPAAVVENAGWQIGMPVGPLAVLDEVSLKLADDVLHQELADLEREAAGHADHDHDHGHGHECGHEHDHGDDHGHGHDHEHGSHEHEHGHHDHAHGERHSHGHEHEHEHAHGSAEAHKHEHGHGHDHEPEHAHAHSSHEHSHGHDHHKDDHSHDHDHDHGQTKSAPSRPAAAAAATRPAHRHVHKVKSRRMPESAVYVLEKMAHGFKRMGRAHGGGFYDYPEDGEKSLWPGLKVFERGARPIPLEDMKDRLLYVQALETIRCLQEGVLQSTRDANIGSIFGWGFPAYTGGTAQFVNHVGVPAFVARARELAARYGERFEPPALLLKLLDEGKPL